MNKLIEQYNNSHHRSIDKKLMKLIILLILLKLATESGLLSTRTFLTKVTLNIGQEKYLFLILFGKLIYGRIKPNIYTNKKIIGNFYEKELLLIKS